MSIPAFILNSIGITHRVTQFVLFRSPVILGLLPTGYPVQLSPLINRKTPVMPSPSQSIRLPGGGVGLNLQPTHPKNWGDKVCLRDCKHHHQIQ